MNYLQATTVPDFLKLFCKFIPQVSETYVAIFPEFFLILSISIILIYLVVLDYINEFKIILTSITGLIFIIIYVLYLILLNNNKFSFIIFNNLLNLDFLILLLKNVLIVTILCCILISFSYIKFEKIIKYEYFILLAFASLGILTVISSNDLISFYIAIEIQSLAFYVLSAIKIYNNFSTEAGLKYFILGAFSSGLLLFGCSFIYGSIGTTNFIEIRLLISDFSNNIPRTFILGVFFIIISLLFKIGAAPFHM
jgi:NADH:ubiquinone oxidoreductase subunit 2 (subunit N)